MVGFISFFRYGIVGEGGVKLKKLQLLLLAVILAGCGGTVEAETEPVPEEETNWTDYNLVAHALGGIDGHRYTNSMEGFKLAYENGFRVFEIDFMLTSDERLVALHHWDDKPITYDEFMSTKVEDEYTPLDVAGVYDLFSQHEDAYLVLDLKAGDDDEKRLMYEIITEIFDDDVLDRTIPQLQFESDLMLVREYYDFEDFKYTLYRTDATDPEVIEFAKENGITAVVMSKKRHNDELVRELAEHGILTYVHTINDGDVIREFWAAGVHGIYTDFAVPK